MYTENEIRQRLSISTFVFYGYYPICRNSLENLTQNGIRKIELLECPDQFDMTKSGSMKMVRDLCDSTGVEVAAYHCFKTNFDHLDTERDFLDRLDKCQRQIDTLLELGGGIWGSHAGVQDRYMLRAFDELARHIEGKPVAVTVENFSRIPLAERIRFLRQMDHPQVGLILDIGHEKNSMGENIMTIPGVPTDIIQSSAKFLKHIHLHGYLDKDHYPPFVEGDRIRWGELFSALEMSDYPGSFNFEPAGEPMNSFPEVVQSVGQAPGRIASLRSDFVE